MVLAPEFTPEFSALDLETLGAYQICLKLAVNGLTSRPFSARTFSSLFPPVSAHQRDIILRVSREKYGIQRSRIESKIHRWLAHSPTQGHESARTRSL